jgi:two-component system, cell cycle sensor histidine kinase and response regulator CckA
MILNPAQHPPWLRYVIAVLAVALAAAVRAALLGDLWTRAPFVTFYPAVILAALIGGLPGGLLATVLSAAVVSYAWMEPVGQFSMRDTSDWVSLGVFVTSCAMICWATRVIGRAQARASEAEAQVKLAIERSRAEEELRHYKVLAEHSRDVILYLQRDDGHILEANAAAAKTYGYTHDELLSLSIHDLRVPDTLGLVADQLAAADDGGIQFETVHRRKDGGTFPVEVSSQGATIGGTRTLVSVIRDITDRKATEDSVRENETLLRSLFESPEVMRGIVEIVDGTIVHLACNEAAAKMYGVDRASIAGKSAIETGAPEETARAWVGLYAQSQRTGKPVSMEYGRRDADGQDRWLYATASHLGTGRSGNLRFTYTILDLTERKRIEEALRQSESRLRTLGDNLPKGAIYQYRQDRDGKPHVDFISAGIERLTGVPAAEYMADAAAVQRNILPDDFERMSAMIALSCERLERFEVEVRHQHRVTGEIGWSLLRSTPSRRPDGSTVWDGIELDISERKRAEEEIQRQREWLRLTLNSIGDAVLATDAFGKITFLNSVAAQLTGWTETQALGEQAQDVLRIVNEQTGEMAEDITGRVLREASVVTMANHTLLVRRDGREVPIEDSAAPILDGSGNVAGVVVVFHDVTERRRAQEALRESEEQFRTLANAIPQLCWMANADGWIFWYNQRWYQYTGTTPQQMEGWGWQSVHDPEVLPRVRKRWEASLANGDLFDMVFPLRGADGTFRPFLTRVMPVLDREGKVARWFGTNTDISEQRKTEEELRLSEERLRLAQTRGRVGVWDWNRPTGALHFTPELEQLYGLEPGAIRTYEDWRRLAHPGDIETIEAERDMAIANREPFDLEFRILHASGETRWLSARGGAFYDEAGEAIRVLGVNVDITARKRVEQALAEAVQRLDAHMDNSPLAVIEFDPQFRVTRWSKEAEKLFGWAAQEVLGRAITELRWIHEEDVEAVLRASLAMLEGRLSRSVSINRNYCKDGSVVECEWYNSAIYGEDGKLTSVLSQVMDVTARKRSEEKLRQAQKLESIGLLAGGVAHDFNNLLVGVIGNASLAKDILPPDHPAADLLGAVLSTGEQAAHLTRQMLAYSGKGKFVVEPLNLSALIPEMSGLVRPSIPKKIVLQVELDHDLPPVEADRGQMQQVFMNLVLNAAEAIGSHEGLIMVRTGVQEVDERYTRRNPDVAALPPGRYVYLEVRDNGCGMDEATKARIFDPFFSTKFTGRGLGLAAVSGIIRGHRAAIMVSSAPGKGSSFTVLFPAAVRAAAEPAAQARIPALQGAGTILVVDDEQVVREMAKRSLERHGYTVLLADSGLAAIDLFRRHPGEIALVVLDLSMPNMNGEEALPELRKIRPDVKVVVSSGYSESEAMTVFQGQRVSGFMQKPYTSRGIAEKVQACLE